MAGAGARPSPPTPTPAGHGSLAVLAAVVGSAAIFGIAGAGIAALVGGPLAAAAIALAVYITRRRWAAAGGDPALVYEVATWAVPAGIIGGRIYFDITTPVDITPHTWWGPFAGGREGSASGAAWQPGPLPERGGSGARVRASASS